MPRIGWCCTAYQTFAVLCSAGRAGVLINVVDTFYILRTGLINATGIFLRRADSGDRSRQSFTVVSGLPHPSGHSALRGFEATDRPIELRRSVKQRCRVIALRGLRENGRTLRASYSD